MLVSAKHQHESSEVLWVHKCQSSEVSQLSLLVQCSYSSGFSYPMNQFSSVAQLCATLCNPMDFGPPDSSVHEILQCPFPGDLVDPGITPVSPIAPALQADSLGKNKHQIKIQTYG